MKEALRILAEKFPPEENHSFEEMMEFASKEWVEPVLQDYKKWTEESEKSDIRFGQCTEHEALDGQNLKENSSSV